MRGGELCGLLWSEIDWRAHNSCRRQSGAGSSGTRRNLADMSRRSAGIFLVLAIC